MSYSVVYESDVDNSNNNDDQSVSCYSVIDAAIEVEEEHDNNNTLKPHSCDTDGKRANIITSVASGASRNEDEKSKGKDWNEVYQTIYEQTASTNQDLREKTINLDALVDEFMIFAKCTGETLVKELHLNNADRTLPCWEDAGGVAGGSKYIVRGVLFKFAADFAGVYGSDEYAQKAAHNELRAISEIIGCNLPNLHTSLTGLVMVYGHCIIATALLPVGKETLVFGSADAGVTVLDRNPSLKLMTQQVGQKLGLMEHWVVGTRQGRVSMFVCGDAEGHVGKDGRLYILDLARLLPPVPRVSKYKCSPLHMQYRPEFLRKYVLSNATLNPLSSDALMGWGSRDPAFSKHNSDIASAFNVLVSMVVPNVVKMITEGTSDVVQGKTSITAMFHHHGVNMRYCGLVLDRIPEGTSDLARALLIAEIVSRTVGNEMAAKFRQEGMQLSSLSSADALSLACCLVAVKFLNRIFRVQYCDDNSLLLDQDIEHHIKNRYETNIPGHYLKHLSSALQCMDLKSAQEDDNNDSGDIWVAASKLFYRRLLQKTGIVIVTDRIATDKRISLGDIQLDPREKRIKLPPLLQHEEAREMLVQELNLRENSLGREDIRLVSTLQALADLYSLHRGAIQAEEAETLAIQYMTRAVSIVEKNSPTYLQISQILQKFGEVCAHFGKYSDSEKAFSRALEILQISDSESSPSQIANVLFSNGFRCKSCARWADAKNFFVAALKKYSECEDGETEEIRMSKALTQGELAQVENTLKYQEAALKNFAEAISTLELLPSSMKRDKALIESLCAYGIIMSNAKNTQAAEESIEKALSLAKSRYGESHAQVAEVLFSKAHLYALTDRDEVIRYAELSKSLFDECLGPSHPRTLTVQNHIATVCISAKYLDKAEELLTSAMEQLLKLYGNNSPKLCFCFYSWGMVCTYRNNHDEAIKYYQRIIEFAEKFGNALDLQFLNASCMHLATLYSLQHRSNDALTLWERAIVISKMSYGAKSQMESSAYKAMSGIYTTLGDRDKALEMMQKSLDINLNADNADPNILFSDWMVLGYSRMGRQQFDEAKECFQKMLEMVDKGVVPATSRLTALSAMMAMNAQMRNMDEVKRLQEEMAKLTAK